MSRNLPITGRKNLSWNLMISKVPFPNNETFRELLLTSSLAGLSVYILLIIYQPYGTSDFQHSYKYMMLFPYAVISFLSFSSLALLFSRKKQWTLAEEICKNFLILLTASVASYFYNALILSRVHLNFENYLYMLGYTAALFLPVIIIFILGRYIHFNRQPKLKTSTVLNQNKSQYIAEEKNLEVLATTSSILRITSEYGNYSLEIPETDFIYAEAADNYCIVYFYRNNSPEKEMIRISLSKLLQQVQTDVIRQTHRSFIVNLSKVIRSKGNSSGYKLSLDNLNNELTISRNFIPAVLPILKDLTIRP
nr:LytTR family DNA-binding domain-containing protein [uncultured Chryseobacterium sp.]